MTTRRDAVCVGAVSLLTVARTVLSQGQPMRRIVYLSLGSNESSGALIDQFRLGLRELGWIEGNNLQFDIRYAHGDASCLQP